MDLHALFRFSTRLDAFEWHDGGGSGWQALASVAQLPADPAPPRPAGAWNGPHSVDIDADGRLYVTCYYGAAIHVLSASGEPLAQLGAGVLSGPASAFLDSDGRLLVAEYAQNAVIVLERDGTVRRRLTGVFDRPHMVRAMFDGTIAVADTWNNRVQRFTAGGDPIEPVHAADIACPVAIDPDADGGMLVAAWGEDSIIALDAHGQRQGRLAGPALRHPYDARRLGSGVVVADSHHARVLIFENPQFLA